MKQYLPIETRKGANHLNPIKGSAISGLGSILVRTSFTSLST